MLNNRKVYKPPSVFKGMLNNINTSTEKQKGTHTEEAKPLTHQRVRAILTKEGYRVGEYRDLTIEKWIGDEPTFIVHPRKSFGSFWEKDESVIEKNIADRFNWKEQLFKVLQKHFKVKKWYTPNEQYQIFAKKESQDE